LQALAHLAFNKPSSAQTLSCLLFNARSLCNKLFEFHYILYNNDHVIIMIIETWLTPELTNGLLDPNNLYDIYRCDRSSRGGGVCILCHRSMRSYQIDIDIQYRDLELLNIHVFFNSVKLSLILVRQISPLPVCTK